MKVNAVESYRLNNIQFEGKKNKEVQKPAHSSNPMKAVPVAVLIAMSPLNAPVINAQQTTSANPQTEIVQNTNKIIAETQYTNATPNGKMCEMQFISTDGNDDDIEKVMLSFPLKKYKTIKNNNGENIRTYQYTKTTIQADALKKVVYKDKYGLHEDEIEYYVVGPADIYASPLIDTKTNIVVSTKEAQSKKSDNYSFRISTKFYNDLADMFEDNIKYINEEHTILF